MDGDGNITNYAAFVDRICTSVGCDTIPGNTFKLIAYACGSLFTESMSRTDRGTSTFDCSTCECDPCIPPVVVYKGTEVERGIGENGKCYVIVDSEHIVADNNEETGVAWQSGQDVTIIPTGWDTGVSKAINWTLVSGSTPSVTLAFPNGSTSYTFSVSQGDCVWYMQNAASAGQTFRMRYEWDDC
jgi:hypothetical protein